MSNQTVLATVGGPQVMNLNPNDFPPEIRNHILNLNERMARVELEEMYLGNVLADFEFLPAQNQVILAKSALEWTWVAYADIQDPKPTEVVFYLLLELSFLSLPIAEKVIGNSEIEPWYRLSRALLRLVEPKANEAKIETGRNLSAVVEARRKDVKIWETIIFGGCIDRLSSTKLRYLIRECVNFGAVLSGYKTGFTSEATFQKEALMLHLELLNSSCEGH